VDKIKIQKLYDSIINDEHLAPHIMYAKYHPPLSEEDIFEIRLDKLAQAIHAEDFREEYDFMYDSVLDKKDRDNGISPMSKEYIENFTKKRKDLGVCALSENSWDRVSNVGSFELSLAKAEEFLLGLASELK
jgi:hypothetical protein